MKFEYYVAQRLQRAKGGSSSSPAVAIATVGMAIGLVVMILSIAIVIGFKTEVRNKVVGFTSHIQVSDMKSGLDSSFETTPISPSQTLSDSIQIFPNVSSVTGFAAKPGLIKTEGEFEGVLFKGVGSDYDRTFLDGTLVEGTIPAFGQNDTVRNRVAISQYLADRLGLKSGDSFLSYYFCETVKVRRLHVGAVYNSNFADFDKMYVFADIRLIQELNDWQADEVSGLEVKVDDFSRLAETNRELFFALIDKTDQKGNNLIVRSVEEMNPQVFLWLSVLDTNVWILIVLMVAVSGFSMISGILITILERTQAIGVLKAMGADNGLIRKTFLWVAFFMIGKGMLLGNTIGLSLCWLQAKFHLLSLDPQFYFIDFVPIEMNWGLWLLLNASVLGVTVLMMVIPTQIISKISPAKTMNFE